jgi:hypothetical protein
MCAQMTYCDMTNSKEQCSSEEVNSRSVKKSIAFMESGHLSHVYPTQRKFKNRYESTFHTLYHLHSGYELQVKVQTLLLRKR